MADDRETTLIHDFLGSSHAFALAINDVIEDGLWTDASGQQLSVTQMRLLKLVSRPGSSHTITDVGTFLGVSNAAASKAVDKLVRLMLVKRREGESDRRAIHLSLTGPGRRLLESYDAAVTKKLAEVFGQIRPEEVQQAVQFLDNLSSAIIGEQRRTPERSCVLCGIYFREKCPLRQRLGRRCLYTRAHAGERQEATEPEAAPEQKKHSLPHYE
jgi:DNA-binding MarR family transcriptional regulator